MEKKTSVKRFERVDLVCDKCYCVVQHTGSVVRIIDGGVSYWIYKCPKCHKEYRIPFHKHYPYIEAVPEVEALEMTLFKVDFDAKDGTVDTDLVVAVSRSQARQQIIDAYGLEGNASVIVEAVKSVGGYKIRLVEE